MMIIKFKKTVEFCWRPIALGLDKTNTIKLSKGEPVEVNDTIGNKLVGSGNFEEIKAAKPKPAVEKDGDK